MGQSALQGGKGESKEEPKSDCKPFDKDVAEGCNKPVFSDRDGDGCIDSYACTDKTESGVVGDPKDEVPVDKEEPKEELPPKEEQPKEEGGLSCKPIDKEAAEGCNNPVFSDRDGDGCIDSYACNDKTESGVVGDPKDEVPVKKDETPKN